MDKRETLIKALTNNLRTETVAVIHAAMEDSPRTVAFVNVEKTLTTKKKLEKAFMLTNSIEDAWYNSKKITKMFEGTGCRSTMVGDMVLIGKEKFKVEPMGWSKV